MSSELLSQLTEETLAAYVADADGSKSYMKTLRGILLLARPPVVLPDGWVSVGGKGQMTEKDLCSLIHRQLECVRSST